MEISNRPSGASDEIVLEETNPWWGPQSADEAEALDALKLLQRNFLARHPSLQARVMQDAEFGFVIVVVGKSQTDLENVPDSIDGIKIRSRVTF